MLTFPTCYLPLKNLSSTSGFSRICLYKITFSFSAIKIEHIWYRQLRYTIHFTNIFYPQGNPMIPLKNCRSFMTHERADSQLLLLLQCVCFLSLTPLTSRRKNSVQTSIFFEFFDSSNIPKKL